MSKTHPKTVVRDVDDVSPVGENVQDAIESGCHFRF